MEGGGSVELVRIKSCKYGFPIDCFAGKEPWIYKEDGYMDAVQWTVLMWSLGSGGCDYRDVACDVECNGRAMEGLWSAETKHINIKTKRTKST